MEERLLMRLKANCLSYAGGGQSLDLVLLCSSPDLQMWMKNENLLLQVDPLTQSIPEKKKKKKNDWAIASCLEQE